jgi:hypothetical protein
MERRTAYATLACIIALVLAASSHALAGTYSYADAEGVVHMTNDYEGIPPAFRESARALDEDTHLDSFAPAPGTANAPEAGETATLSFVNAAQPALAAASLTVREKLGFLFNSEYARSAFITVGATIGIVVMGVVFLMIVKIRAARYAVLAAMSMGLIGGMYIFYNNFYLRMSQDLMDQVNGIKTQSSERDRIIEDLSKP